MVLKFGYKKILYNVLSVASVNAGAIGIASLDGVLVLLKIVSVLLAIIYTVVKIQKETKK